MKETNDLAAFDAAVNQDGGGNEDLSAFDEATSAHTAEKRSLELSDIPKIAAAPLVKTSQMFNPIAAGIRATWEAYKNGTPFEKAYSENMSRIKAAQDQILESSPTAKAFGYTGELAAAIAMPGTKLAGATLGALEGARESTSAGEAVSKGLAGGAAGYGLGMLGNKAKEMLPTAERSREFLSSKKATETFNASADNLKNYLKAVPGDTLSSKMRNFGDFLFKKAVVGGGKAIDEVEKQTRRLGDNIKDAIESIKGVAKKENPEVDSMEIYEKIKDDVLSLQPDKSVVNTVEELFSPLIKDKGKVTNGKKTLVELEQLKNKVETKVGRLYNKPYDKLTPVEKDLVDSFDIFREHINDVYEDTITKVLPEKAGEYARLRSDGHMIFQLERFARDRAAELSAKAMDKDFARGGIMQTGINAAARAVIPSAERLRGPIFPDVVGGARKMLSTGQKVPYLLGRGEGQPTSPDLNTVELQLFEDAANSGGGK